MIKKLICLIFAFTITLKSKAEVVEIKPQEPDVIIQNTTETKLFDLDPKRRQIVITTTGVYLIEKQSVKNKLFGKCKAK